MVESVTECEEVVVKFRNNQNGQDITYRDGPTFAHSLRVVDNSRSLSILFLDKDGKAVKTIVFPVEVVREYSCSVIRAYEGACYGN